jgi:hypothetical protein
MYGIVGRNKRLADLEIPAKIFTYFIALGGLDSGFRGYDKDWQGPHFGDGRKRDII